MKSVLNPRWSLSSLPLHSPCTLPALSLLSVCSQSALPTLSWLDMNGFRSGAVFSSFLQRLWKPSQSNEWPSKLSSGAPGPKKIMLQTKYVGVHFALIRRGPGATV